MHKLPLEKRVELYNEAVDLRETGLSPRAIEKVLRSKYGYSVAAQNINKWVYHNARPDTRANIPNLTPSPQLSYFLGAFKGDGYDYLDLKKRIYRVGFRVKDRDFLERVSRVVTYVLRRRRISLWTVTGARGAGDLYYVFTVTSWALRKFLRGSLSALLAVALKYPRDFLRGVFDAEGFVSVGKDGKRLRIYIGMAMSDRRILSTVQRTLIDYFGLKVTGPYRNKSGPRVVQGHVAKFRRDVFVIHISSLQDIEGFATNVGFAMKRKRDRLREALNLLHSHDSTEALEIWRSRVRNVPTRAESSAQ